MPNIVAVRFRYNPKQLWFDPLNTLPEEGDHVIVETERGTEIGLACSGVFEVSDEDIKALPSSLKPVVRIADKNDLVRADDLARKGDEAMPVFRELAEKYKLDMKPVRVEYLFSGDKAVFYFASEERIDFRELVRELAGKFHVRVDMRQIGVRDEARLIGGISHCGQELCCSRFGSEFQPVSIRMAKEQDLPLNPLKISGLCGRLMCCLRYEFEAYKDFKSRAPKRGGLIETPLGLAKVVDFDTPREIISMRFEDGKLVNVPLSKMECEKGAGGECGRPCKVSREVIEECSGANPSIDTALAALDRKLEDGVAETHSAGEKRTPRRRKPDVKQTSASSKAQPASEKTPSQPADSRKPRRRRSSSAGQGQGQAQGQSQGPVQGQKQNPQKTNAPQHSAAKSQTTASGPRPGQHSSGIRAKSSGASNVTANAKAKTKSAAPQKSGQNGEDAAKRKPRRRHPGSNGAGTESKEN